MGGQLQLKSYKSYGLSYTGSEYDSDDVKCEVYGRKNDCVLGLVTGRIYKWRGTHDLTYMAECGFHGREIHVRESRAKGKLTHASLSIWMTKHAIPALKAHAMEINP